jgi:hypothetical protein
LRPRVGLKGRQSRPETDDSAHGAGEVIFSQGFQPLAVDHVQQMTVEFLSVFKRSRAAAQLTAAQRRFAQEHKAIPGMRSGVRDRLVFVYRDGDCGGTQRWLVDPAGRVVDFASLR